MSPKKPLQKATVIRTACEHQSQAPARADKSVLEKIQKCLNRAYHAKASEAEAKTALFISQKLMSEHNVAQADLIAHDDRSNKVCYGGRSIVRIEKVAHRGGFSTDFGISVEWSFFGIASNTVAAAIAFEMAHNLILEWGCVYKGGAPTFSYRLGVADGLQTMANREKQNELAEVQRNELDSVAARSLEEEKELQRELDMVAELSAEAKSTSDQDDEDMASLKFESDNENNSDSNDIDGWNIKADFSTDDLQTIDLCDDVDENIETYMKREPTKPPNPNEIPESLAELARKVEPETKPPTPMASCWKSQMQLVRFRATSEQVADDYLAQHKIKLRSGRKRKSTIRDKDSYHRGQQDSSKINVRQTALA
ncbi:hypothetical protein PENARI_c039G12346 [Penicillium arizonense]|uniref:Uncharacterized protein n=1 Tax=Penicillium arizonense TaxID=1835702 RepID=A0A1F5L3M3_PENAI|nr:hypothetical protein PENARI_c039G12346 [Penicillium arizonense]OGE47657.1 hypothetical protein PENARI_c039G12346 [Penicillium arizonense]